MALSEIKTNIPKWEIKDEPQTNGSYKIRQIIIKIMEYTHIHGLPWWLRWYSVCLQCETGVQSQRREDPLEKAVAPHSRTLAWKTPWTEEPGGLQSTGSLRVGHGWATALSPSHIHILTHEQSRISPTKTKHSRLTRRTKETNTYIYHGRASQGTSWKPKLKQGTNWVIERWEWN